MMLHPIDGVEITRCSVEQRAAYWAARSLERQCSDIVRTGERFGNHDEVAAFLQSLIALQVANMAADPSMRDCDIDAVSRALSNGLAQFLRQPREMDLAEIGEAFPIS